MNEKKYLGDGVYAEFVEGDLVLTTENGVSVTNQVVLDYWVMTQLESYIQEEKTYRAFEQTLLKEDLK